MKIKSLLTISLICCVMFLGPTEILADTVASSEQTSALQDTPAKAIDEWFPDDNLAEEMRKLLGKTSTADMVSQEELDMIQDINFLNKGIHDLTGLENLRELNTCDLSSNPISDIQPLMNLQELWYLKLDGTDVTDLSAFLTADLPLLSNLYLSYIGNIDLTNLKNLPQLGALQVKSDQLTNLDALKELPQLYSLWAEGNQLTDITGLTEQTHLNYLYLDYNQISDIHPLAGMSELREVSLTENQVTDISPLGSLPSLVSYNAKDQYVVNEPRTVIPSQPFTIDNQMVAFDGTVLAPIDAYPVAYTYEESVLSWEFSNVQNESSVYYVGMESTAKGDFLVSIEQPLIHDLEPPVITADPEITYTLGAKIDQAAFLDDIHAATNDGSEIISNFTEQVNFKEEGDYTVTLNASDASGNAADPVTVIVHIVKEDSPIDDGGADSDNNDPSEDGNQPDNGQNQLEVNENTPAATGQVTQNMEQGKTKLPETDALPKTGDTTVFGWMMIGSFLVLLSSYWLLRYQKCPD
ncbi:LapB repeat-containing protein [Listeria ilorinensis]|uniref:LapB repeat-containing protein n=1 Tax=Listeria ilorinensis TaxID=2867439 RepID=UPI001EF48EDA|nr:LapB repeat-containing protein [Listeria ilorinensis]